jgi:homoserine O-acetyltransferase
VRLCVLSFSSDWMFPTYESRAIVHGLNAAAANVSFVEIQTDQGHDSFLLDIPDYHRTLTGFLDGAAAHRGLTKA